jgi:hypothetical protein
MDGGRVTIAAIGQMLEDINCERQSPRTTSAWVGQSPRTTSAWVGTTRLYREKQGSARSELSFTVPMLPRRQQPRRSSHSVRDRWDCGAITHIEVPLLVRPFRPCHVLPAAAGTGRGLHCCRTCDAGRAAWRCCYSKLPTCPWTDGCRVCDLLGPSPAAPRLCGAAGGVVADAG